MAPTRRTEGFDTLAVHAGRSPDPVTGAIVPPLITSTTFERGIDGGEPHGYGYARTDNPNRRALEQCLAALEGGAAAAPRSSAARHCSSARRLGLSVRA